MAMFVQYSKFGIALLAISLTKMRAPGGDFNGCDPFKGPFRKADNKTLAFEQSKNISVAVLLMP